MKGETEEDNINTYLRICGKTIDLGICVGAGVGARMRIPVPSLPRRGCTALVKAHCTPQVSRFPIGERRGLTPGDPSTGWATAGSEPPSASLLPRARAPASVVPAAEGIRLQGSSGRHRGLRRPLLAERRRAAPASGAAGEGVSAAAGLALLGAGFSHYGEGK